MSIQLVTIYAPSGKQEQHTPLNAVDLVRSSGYTYKPGKEYLPTEGAPYADPTTGKLPSRAQEALDSVGTGAEIGGDATAHLDSVGAVPGASQTSEPAPTARPAPAPAAEEAPAPAPEPVIEAAPAETAPAPAAEETPAPAAKPARQQRPKKGA